MAQTADDRIEQIRRIPAMDLKGSPLGSKTTVKRIRWQPDDGGLTPLPNPGSLKRPDGEKVPVSTIGDLLIAYAFWPA